MSTLFTSLLVSHVLLGVIGLIASYRVTLMLLKKHIEISSTIRTAFVAFTTYFLSWLTGGWYYWKYYGTSVKPRIMGGEFPWAHSIFMESKEHVFLFLPFASLCVALVLWAVEDLIQTDIKLKKQIRALSFVVTSLAVIIALSGIVISGAVR
jgi:hypothetical protein